MGFSYRDGLIIRDKITEIGGKIDRRRLANMIREHTNTMVPWWIKTYMQTMVSAKMIEADGEGFRVCKND